MGLGLSSLSKVVAEHNDEVAQRAARDQAAARPQPPAANLPWLGESGQATTRPPPPPAANPPWLGESEGAGAAVQGTLPRSKAGAGFQWPDTQEAEDYKHKVFPRSIDGNDRKLGLCGRKPGVDFADTETMGLIGGVGLRVYFEFLEAFAKLFFFLGCLSLPCIMLNYTSDGLDHELGSSGMVQLLAKTTFGNLYPATVNTIGRIRDCSEFSNSRCCEQEVTGVMFGLQARACHIF
jgi:hypothetical protein